VPFGVGVLYRPDEEVVVTVIVEVPEPRALKDMLLGFADIEAVFVEIDDDTVTVPAKPLRL
jgi:hypothetical protein